MTTLATKTKFVIAGHIEGDAPVIQIHHAETLELAEEAFENALKALDDNSDVEVYIDDAAELDSILSNPVSYYGNKQTTENTQIYAYHEEDGEPKIIAVSASYAESIPPLFAKFETNFSKDIHIDAIATLESLLAA